MPTYEYFCQECNKKFEIKASMSEKEKGLNTKCPNCGSKKTIQMLGSFSFLKGKGQNSGGCCGPNTSSGCCG